MNKIFSNRISSLFLSTTLMFSCFVSSFALANDDDEAWRMLKEGEAVAVMRHALAPKIGKHDATKDISCKETYRKLSQQGLDQAMGMGNFFREHGVLIANTYSSPMCRNIQTANVLGFNPSSVLPILDSFIHVSDGVEETKALAKWIKDSIENRKLNTPSTNVLVTHKSNISFLIGKVILQGDVAIVGMKDDKLAVLLTIPAR